LVELTKAIFEQQDLQVSLLERTMGSYENVRTAFLEFYLQNKDKMNGKMIQDLSRDLNNSGGVFILSLLSKDDVKQRLKQLLNLNYITIKNWEYRSLGLTNKTVEILTGGKKLSLRKQEFVASKDKKEKKKVKGPEAQHGRQDLFSELRDLRNSLAKEKGLPSYIVFNDKSLHDMCAILPRNEEEFLLVHGVGESKLENYGASFLKIIKRHLK
jgi:ATP-dependent DNA helicase RecQ